MKKATPAKEKKHKHQKDDPKSMRVLLIEDNEDDALLVLRELKKGGFNPVYERVETAAAMKKALKEEQWDIILSDYKLPKLDGIHAISLLKEVNMDIPLILVSGTIGEETAVECMRAGAVDYVMKNNLTRLCPAIKRELKEAQARKRQRKAEENLFKNQLLLNETQKIAGVGGWEYDLVNRHVSWTDEAYRIYGVSNDFDLNNIEQNIKFYSPGDQKIITQAFWQAVKNGIPYDLELKFINARGNHLWVRTIGKVEKKQGKIVRVFGYIQDITERKKAEVEFLQKAEQVDILNKRLEFAMDATHTNTNIIDADFNLLYVDERWQKIYGAPEGMKCYKYFMGTNKMCPDCAIPQALKTKKIVVSEEILAKENNRIVEVHTIPFQETDGTWKVFEFNIDITRRKIAEEKLKASEHRLDRAMAVKNEGIWDWNLVTNETFFDERYYTIAGYAPNEFPQNFTAWAQHVHPDDLLGANTAIQDYLSGKSKYYDTEFRFKHKNGSWIWIYGRGIIATRDANGKPLRMIGTHTDITERKEAQEKLQQSEEKYRSLVQNAQEGVYQTSADGKLLTVNESFAHILGYKSVSEILKAVTNISNQIYVYPRDRKRLFKIVEKYGAVTNFESQFYRKDGSRVWVSISSSAALDDQKRVLYYQGMVQDISEKKQLEVERVENVKILRKALGATISAMAVMVETRDPYTAGHQRRVADLARAIATEMRLPSDQIDGVLMAGMIHDIGKISIPSEILTKPTQLTALEFNLIKTHPDSGYAILKNIEFPWPIARIALEHHERVNGSGYPRALKEKEILLESKIMAVADVVEAISSHRPYRAAHGIEAALQEIADNRGVLYDAEVVDACLRLFREKSYTLAA